MIRPAGLALGAAILVAVPGSRAAHGSAAPDVIRHGWRVAAALPAASIVPAMTVLGEDQ